ADNDDNTATPQEVKVATVYINPKDNLSTIDVSVTDVVIATEEATQVRPDDYTQSLAAQTNPIKVINSTVVSADAAAIELGSNLKPGFEDIVKFDLYLDAINISLLDANATEIRGAQFSLDIDGTLLESVANFSSDTGTLAVDKETGLFTFQTNTGNDFLWANSTAVADNDDNTATPQEVKVATVYLNPKDDTTDIDISVINTKITTDASDISIEPLGYTIDVF
ncbi:MAG: hypothetical protein NZ811_02455, partial [Gammaproteobacteria bacterium]|nr:hypothetical protein [Gammaproteobacteria bacterium]